MARPAYLDPDVPTIYCDDETGEVVNELGAPTGTIAYFSLASAPDGWLKANGAAITVAAYPDLYDAIGSTYNTGGEAAGTFRVPDLRGEFIRSLDDGRGVDAARSLGSTQSELIKNHTHTIRGGNYFGARKGSDAGIDWYSARANANDLDYYGMDNSGGGAETRPRNLAFLACIKY